MAIQANYKGYVSGTGRGIYTGAGYLMLLIASHSEATAQTVTFYDNHTLGGNILFQFQISADADVLFIQFPESCRPQFENGLAIDPSGCDVFVIVEGIA